MIGDFNFDASENNVLTKYLKKKGYCQMVKNPTHEKGRIIDHVYVPKHETNNLMIKLAYPFFTDHAAICIKLLNV